MKKTINSYYWKYRPCYSLQALQNPQQMENEKDDSMPTPPVSKELTFMRFAHYSPNVPPVDIYVDDKLTVQNLNFGETSQYKAIEPGNHTIKLFTSKTSEVPFFEETLTVPAGMILTTALIDVLAKLKLQINTDSIRITPGETMIQFTNLSPNAPALDLIVNNDLIFTFIAFPQVTEYIPIQRAINYDIKLRTTGTDDILLEKNNVILERNNAYTFNTIGLFEGEPPLQLDMTLDGSSYLT